MCIHSCTCMHAHTHMGMHKHVCGHAGVNECAWPVGCLIKVGGRLGRSPVGKQCQFVASLGIT